MARVALYRGSRRAAFSRTPAGHRAPGWIYCPTMFHPEDASSPHMRRLYVWAVIVEVIVLAGLWALARIYS